jgi:hypothetical protein
MKPQITELDKQSKRVHDSMDRYAKTKSKRHWLLFMFDLKLFNKMKRAKKAEK